MFERKNVIICVHSLILFFRKLKLFIKGQIQFDTFGPIIWSLMTKETKTCDIFASFISKVRQWRPDAF